MQNRRLRCGAFLVVALVGSVLAPGVPAPAFAAEPVAERDLSLGEKQAVRIYRRRSESALGRLVRLIVEGKDGSESTWRSACVEVTRVLDDMERRGFNEGVLKAWLADEKEAWDKLLKVGGGISATNAALEAWNKALKKDVQVSKSELKTIVSAVTSRIDSVMNPYKAALEELDQLSSKAEGVIKDAGDVLESTLLDEWQGIVEDGRDQVDDLKGIAKRADRIEHWLRRFRGAIRRRKTRFQLEAQRELAGYRRELARLVREDIDPDQKGVFVKAERQMEEAAQERLEAFEEQLEEWEGVNAPLLDNTKEFAVLFVWPVVKKHLQGGLPDEIGDVELPDFAFDADEILHEAMARAGAAGREYWRKIDLTFWKKVEQGTSGLADELAAGEKEHEQARRRLLQRHRLAADAIREKSEKEVEKLEARFAKLMNDLGAVPEVPEDNRFYEDHEAKRKRLLRELEDTNTDLDLERAALERHLRRLLPKQAKEIAAFEKAHIARQEELRERLAALK